MMRAKLLVPILIIVTMGCAARAGDAEGSRNGDVPGPYVWPLAGQTNISAGFADYRTRHFHGGIDISTGGKEGLPVRAADSGWVLRVSTSWWGFGKVVYLQLAGGRVAVYGHLSELAPKIQTYVEDNQYAAKRYLQNLLPAPGQIPIARGELIGHTGQTGAGPPHLHFELRTNANRPINPLVSVFSKPDQYAPVIHSVTLIPRQPGRWDEPLSTVNGFLTSRTFEFTGLAGSRVLASKPSVDGMVGLSLRADDIIDGPNWVVSAYRCRLFVNDELICEVRHDSIDYNDTRLIDLERLHDNHPGIAERPINLFRLPGNRLWNYTGMTNDGWLQTGKTLRTGANNLRIEVSDAAGNSSFADFELIAEPPSALRDTGIVKQTSPSSPTVRDIDWNSNGAILEIGRIPRQPLSCFLDQAMTRPLATGDLGAGKAGAWIPAAAISSPDTIWILSGSHALPQVLSVHSISTADGGTLVSSDGRASAQFGPEDLYESALLRLINEQAPAKARKPMTDVYTLQPVDLPLARAVRFTLSYDGLPVDPQRIALYRLRPEGGWDFISAEHAASEGAVTGKIEMPGSYALLVDQTPPVISKMTPAKGTPTHDKQPLIGFSLSDDLAGIGSDADVTLTIDGNWTVVEYDPETLQAKARPRQPLPPGDHHVEISAKDRMGNETKFQRTLTILK